MSQTSLEQMFHSARRHQAAGRLAEAESLYREILKSEPFHPDVLQTGRSAEAIDLLALALAQRPDDANITGDLGGMLQQAGRYDEALAAYRRFLDLRPDSSDGWFNLGQGLRLQSRHTESLQAFQRAAALNPNDQRILIHLAGALRECGDEASALSAYRRVLDLNPDSAPALSGMGGILHKQGSFADAVAVWRRALQIDPRDAATAYNLGTVLREAAEIDQAIAVLRQSLTANPDQPKAWNNLAGLLKDAGELDESLACYDRAIALEPRSAALHSNRLYTLHFHPDFGAKRLLSEHLEFARRHIASIRPAADHDNDPDPDRPLRVGYVSADFRRHPVGLSFEFLLENHDRQNFSIVCFSNVRHPDADTRRMQTLPEEWHPVSQLSEDELIRLIRSRKIDILVDLSLHMAHNRLTALAHKPAPIQVTYLGYPSTTGLSAIDYRLSDPFIDPPETDKSYTETTIRLPGTYLCWRFGGADAPVRSLPAQSNGYITFGSLNNFCKVTPAVLHVWGRLMSAVKNSRLILRAPAGSASQRALATLAEHGIARERVELVGPLPWDAYVDLYHRQDIGLDPFPYPGHTTSLDSLWMGVPVVTLAGDTGVSRVGASLLSAIQLPELIAGDVERYISIASALAEDFPRLAELRAGLRDRVRRSPISDGAKFARDVEAAYRKMWHTWSGSRR